MAAAARKRSRSPERPIAVEPAPGAPFAAWPPPAAAAWRVERRLHVLDAHSAASPLGRPGQPPVRCALFDLDHTLVRPGGGRRFPRGADDWEWCHPAVVPRLRELHAAGYWAVVLSNQSGAAAAAKAAAFHAKLLAVQRAAGVPMTVLAAAGSDGDRKPAPGMWRFLVDIVAAGREVDRAGSFYVGDAAGRAVPTWTGDKKDFSCSDRKLAANAGLRFATPEEFFLGRPAAPFGWCGWGPEEIAAAVAAAPATEAAAAAGLRTAPTFAAAAGGAPELVVLVGFPGSGKSTLFRRYFEPRGYAHASRDTHKTKWAAAAAAALAAGQSVVVDNTNGSPKARAEAVAVARRCGAVARCLHVATPRPLAAHLNFVRAAAGAAELVPAMAFHVFAKHFVAPAAAEGFAEVAEVRVPLTFDTPEERARFMMLS